MQQRKSVIVFAVLSAMLGAVAAEDWQGKPAQDPSMAAAVAASDERSEGPGGAGEYAVNATQLRGRASSGDVSAMAGQPACCEDGWNYWSTTSYHCHTHYEPRYMSCNNQPARTPECCRDGWSYWSLQTRKCHSHYESRYQYCP